MPKQVYSTKTYRVRESIGYLMKRTSAMMTDRIEATFDSHGFTFTQWVVLMYLRDGIGVTPATICRDIRHDSGALTRVIDQLEERGLIKRKRSREDRRVVELELTSAGRDMAEKMLPLTVNCLNEALDVFTLDEAHQLKSLLQRMFNHLENGSRMDAACGGKSK